MTGDQVVGQLTSIGRHIMTSVKALPVALVRNIFCVLIGFWVLAVMVQLTGVLVIGGAIPVNDNAVNLAAPEIVPAASTAAVATLRQIHLFGEAGAAPIESVRPASQEQAFNATKTRLSLTLEGIVHTLDDSKSIAVIVYQGKQDQYRLGDKLPVGSSVKLVKVFLDHVILDNAGNYESLWLYDENKPSKRSASRGSDSGARAKISSTDTTVTDMRSDQTATSLANDYRDKLYTNPQSLADVLRISPAQKDGKLVGYRVSPGKDKSQFALLGFESNDIVTSINGIELDEPSKALEVYKLMRSATEAAFIVDRSGDLVEVLVSLQEDMDANE